MITSLGIIEGYYGRIYTEAERQSLISFISDIGYSYYIYAPKNDCSLRLKWDDKFSKEKIDFFVVSTNQKETLKLTQKLRQNSKKVDFDFSARKFSKQLEKASKVARYALILGEDELEKGYFSVKNLENGTQEKIDNFEELLKI